MVVTDWFSFSLYRIARREKKGGIKLKIRRNEIEKRRQNVSSSLFLHFMNIAPWSGKRKKKKKKRKEKRKKGWRYGLTGLSCCVKPEHEYPHLLVSEDFRQSLSHFFLFVGVCLQIGVVKGSFFHVTRHLYLM